MGPVIVREFRADDLRTITAIYTEQVLYGTATFDLEPPSEDEMREKTQAVLGAGFPLLVAAAGEAVVGYAYANVFRPRRAYRFTVENSVYVAAEARERGVGRALLEELIRRCAAGGFTQMVAVIGDSANVGSIALHAACGFRQVGTLTKVGYKFERWLDTVTMQRELT